MLRIMLLSLATCVPFVGIHALCLFGTGWSVPGIELFLLVWSVAFMGVLIDLVLLAFPRSRARAKATLCGPCLVLLLLSVPAACAASAVRRLGFSLAAERAAPLVAAIERHEREQGRPPRSLAELVPRYLDRLPDRLPPLEIVTVDEAKQCYRGNDWVLRASVPSGFANFDQFLYFPNGDYPAQGFGGSLERIGAWAYVHE